MKKYFLTFATNFKNENDYLKEWLDYHIMVGVDHFYLYDQDGGEEARELLLPYENAGYVTRHLWTKWDNTKYDGPTKFYQKNKNHMGFAHAAKEHRKEYQWVMKIDVDEFLYPLNEEVSLKTWLESVNPKKIKGIKVPRINFGNNGHENKPKAGLLEAYLKREQSSSDHKDLANGDFLNDNKYCFSAHWWTYKLLKPGKIQKEVDGWRINHYYTKSLEEYKSRQNVSGGRPVGDEGFHEKNHGCNDVEDDGMLKFVKKMKG